MKPGKLYRLHRQGNLLILRAAVGGTDGSAVILRLLVDTGASYSRMRGTDQEAGSCICWLA